MLTIEEIIKKLEELETNEDRLEYLKSILDEIEDEELKEEVKEVIKKLEESLETKLEDIDIPQVRKMTREIDLSDVERDVEQIQRNLPQRATGRPDLAIRQTEEDLGEFRYTSNSNYSNASLYQQSSFDYQTLQNSFNTDFLRESVVRENILNPERVITEVEKENLSKKLRESMPGASEEKILMYQAKLSDELRKDEKAKYIARLK